MHFKEQNKKLILNPMNNNMQNSTTEKENSNPFIEVSLTIVFVSIIVFTCLVLFGA